MVTNRALVALATAFCFSGAAAAQQPAAWPQKPVRFVVAFPPAGIVDIIARPVAQKLSDAWGQPVVIDNRGGASGNIATRLVAKAPPDGYTVLVHASAYAVNPSLSTDAGYDPQKDLKVATFVAGSPNVIVAAPKLAASSLAEAIALARAGKLNYGSPGAGTTPHLSAAYVFKVLARVDVVHIPFQGGGPALNATMGGQVEFASVPVPPAVQLIKAGRVKGLAVTSKKRVTAIPDVPTVTEAGLPEVDHDTWVGLFLPAGTPPEAVSRLHAAIADVLATPDMKDRLSALAFEAIGGKPDDSARYLAAEIKKWAEVVRQTGAKID
jgi:tripartite-type tricarboxylate transporter receptor subunit TctC